MDIKYGTNLSFDDSLVEDFVRESDVDFVVFPSVQNVAERQRIEHQNDFDSILNSVELFTRDYDSVAVEKSREYMGKLSEQLVNCARLGGSGFFAPYFIDDKEVYDPLFRTIFSQTNANFDVIFPYTDLDVFFDVFDSIQPSKFKLNVEPNMLVDVDQENMDKIVDNIQHLSFPDRREEGEDDFDEYRDTVRYIFDETFYDEVYVFIHLVPGKLKRQVNKFRKSKQEIRSYLENVVEVV
jgi:hypothetical protein